MDLDNPDRASVVVIGLDPTGLAAVRSLRKSPAQDIPIIGIFESLWEEGAYTSLCDWKYYCKDLGSSELIEGLTSLGRRLPLKPVLILTMDRTVLLVSDNREQLNPYYRFLLPSKNVVNLLMDKTKFAVFASDNGFSIPKTWIINSKDDLKTASKEAHFPCFLKPRYRGELWQKRAYPKGFRSNSPTELMMLFDIIQSTEQHYVLQEWIEGPDTELYFSEVLCDENSRSIASFTGLKLRQWPIEAGSASMAEPVHCPEIERETIRLFESVHMRGLGSVEFKRDVRDNRYKMIEPRVGRVGTRSELATANGRNFPLLAYSYLTRTPVPRAPVRHPVRWIQEHSDIQSCLQLMRDKRLTLREMARSYVGPRCLALFSWKDPLPLVTTIVKDLHGNARGSLWASVRGGEGEKIRATVANASDFLKND